MKLLLAMIFVLSASLPAMARWQPTEQEMTDLVRGLLYVQWYRPEFSNNREAVYKTLKTYLERGMDVESPDSADNMSLLASFATIEWNRTDWRDNGTDFTSWDQKIYDLLIKYGANVNYSWISPASNSRYNVLLKAIARDNLDMVKKLIKSGANPKVSFVTGNFNLRENVLIGPISAWDGEMFTYLFELTKFPVNEIDYCSAADGRMVPRHFWQEQVNETIIRPAFKDYDMHKCKKLLGLE